jgi:membrane-bound serine protease (ClpP class)
VLARSPLALKAQLSKKEGVVSQKEELNVYLNMDGICVTDLRPSGTALIGNRRVDVVTDGEYVEKDTPITVTGIAGNRIVVEAKTQ